MDTELVEGSKVRAEGNKTREESSSKRAGDELEQKKAKKQKVDDDQEAAKMKEIIKIIHDEEEVVVDAIPLATKPPSIVDYKIIKEGKISYYQIIRADGSSKRYSTFIQMLRSFDREDLETMWKLVKAKHRITSVEESLRKQSGRIVGIKRLLDDLRVTAAQLMLLVYKLLLLVFRVTDAGTKLQLLKDYYYGKKIPRESNASSSSTTLNHPSSFHPLDDTLNENNDESFHSNSSSASQNISSSSNVVSRVRQNPPYESHYLNTHLSETINLQTQQRDAHRKGLRSIGQALKNMMGGKQK
ncbi:hypothetical protein Tco_0727028 [Tanacetum coccineum]|uniref:Uncharacterized protein n=1 Tax=Tanacetum coccineum TaxID=301880 RepID=A0ABQ4YI64_9ASTR